MESLKELVRAAILVALVSWAGWAQATVVGTSRGSFNVSAQGEALYQMPLTLPPGIGRMTPQLSLNYSSQGGDLYLGPGWSLSGISSQIARCPGTYAQNGATVGINLTSTDRFCLDGQQLVVPPGTTYGAIGAQYRTEVETFNQVTSVGGTSSNPASFTVKTRGGLTLTYGQTYRVTNTVNGVAWTYIWLLDSSTDTLGNSVHYSWAITNSGTESEYLPSTITYGGSANVVVSFTYGARQSNYIPTGYIDGLPLIHTQTLQRIDTQVNGTAVRHWKLGYLSGNVRDYLATVTECVGGDESQCAQPTVFTWNAFQVGNNLPQQTGNLGLTGTWSGFTGDVNDDGIADVIGAQISGGTLSAFVAPSGSVSQAPTVTTLGTGYPSTIQSGVGDFNGDGRTDLVVTYASGSNLQLKVFLGSGTTFTAAGGATGDSVEAAGAPLVADFNGDGLADVLMWTWNGSAMAFELFASNGTPNNGNLTQGAAFTRASGTTAWTPKVVDLNADGVMDLLLINATSTSVTYQAYLNDGHGNFPSSPNSTATLSGSFTNAQILTADINGDGNADLIIGTQNGTIGTLVSVLSQGNGFFSSPHTSSITMYLSDPRHLLAGDFNGDGLADVAWVDETTAATIDFALSGGNGIFPTQAILSWNGTYGNPNYFPAGHADVAADFNGNGVPCIFSFSDSYGVVMSGLGAPLLRMTGILDGLNLSVTIGYQPITRSPTYADDGTGATFPMVPMRGARYVVSTTQIGNPGNPDRQSTYNYYDARFNAQGRGFLGFNRVDRTDMTGNGAPQIDRIATYYQNFPYIGILSGTQDVDRSNNSAVIDWASFFFTNRYVSATNSYFAYSDLQEGQSFETATGSSVVAKSFAQSDTYGDNDGNLTARSTTQSSGDFGTNPQFFTSIANTYQDNTSGSNWLLGLLTDTQITKYDTTTTGSTSLTRELSANYNQTTGQLNWQKLEPGSSTLQVEADYGYDTLGNLHTATLSGPNFLTRSVSATYSTASPSFGRFPTSTCNALNQCVTRSFDGTTGNVLSATDANNLTVNYSYDVMGRAAGGSAQVVSGGITVLNVSAAITRALCSNETNTAFCNAVANGYFYEETSDSAGHDAVTVYDRAERVVRHAALNGGGNWVETLVTYDAAGRRSTVSSPRIDGTSSSNTFFTSTAYDDLSRPLTITAPSDQNTPTGSITRYGYSGLTTTVTNPRGNPTTWVVDGRGDTRSVTDANNASLTYAYDAFGNLKTVTDPNGNVTQMGYDLLGRKLSQSDPDMGNWSYSYDALGELLTQTDSKSQVFHFSYDLLGRLYDRTDPNTHRSWTWDTLRIGALTEEDLYPAGSGTVTYRRQYGYTAFGAVNTDTQTIDGSRYVTGYQYDTSGRVNQINYPTGFAVGQHYNAYGAEDLLYPAGDTRCPGSSCPYYWQAQGWDEWNGVYLEALGNTAQTQTTRDLAVGMISSILTGKAAAPRSRT